MPAVERVEVVEESEVPDPPVDPEQVEGRRRDEIDRRLVRSEEVPDRGDAGERPRANRVERMGRGCPRIEARDGLATGGVAPLDRDDEKASADDQGDPGQRPPDTGHTGPDPRLGSPTWRARSTAGTYTRAPAQG